MMQAIREKIKSIAEYFVFLLILGHSFYNRRRTKFGTGGHMKQLSLIIDNKVGTLADISFILGKARINIESIATSLVGEKAVIILVVKDEKRAREVLESNNYKVLVSDAFVVKMQDEPGELSKLSKMLAGNGVNIEAIHVLAREGGSTLLSLKVDKAAKAEKLLNGYLVREE